MVHVFPFCHSWLVAGCGIPPINKFPSNKCKNPSAILTVRSNNEKDTTRC